MPTTKLKNNRLLNFLHSCFAWEKPFVRMVVMVALPMMLQQLMTASLHIVDGLMVSGLGDIAYSAVTQASRVSWLFTLICFGVCTGGAIFFSQFWGAREIGRFRHAMGLSMIFAVGIAIIFVVVAEVYPHRVISLFLQEGESFELAVKYLRIVAPSYLFIAIDNVFASAIKAGEKTYYPMISGFVSIALNTLLNYTFIFGNFGAPALGVEGAALATAIAAFVSMCTNIFFAYSKHLPAGARINEWFSFDREFAKQYMKTATPVLLNEWFWAMGILMYSIYYGRMGSVAVAATGIVTTISDLMWVAIFALMNSTAIIVGKTLGEGKTKLAYLYSKRLMAGAILAGVIIGAFLIMLRIPLVNIFSGLSDEVRTMAQRLLLINAFALWFRAFNTINIVGVLRSGGATMYSLVLDTVALWVINVPLVGIFALVLHFPLEIVYASTMLEEAVKMAFGVPYFKSKKWIKVLTEEAIND